MGDTACRKLACAHACQCQAVTNSLSFRKIIKNEGQIMRKIRLVTLKKVMRLLSLLLIVQMFLA